MASKLTIPFISPNPNPRPQPVRGVPFGPRSLFAEAAPIYIESRRNHLSQATLRTYGEFLNKLLAFFGAMRLDEITADDVRAYQAERMKTAGGERINHEIGCVLRPVLKRAKLWAPISDDYERLPAPKSTIGRSLEQEQAERLWQLARSRPEWRVAFRAAQITANTTAGARELKGVRMRHVNIEKAILSIPEGKNRHRQRDIPLNETALEAARDLLKRAKELGSMEPEHYLLPYLIRCKGSKYDPTRPMASWRWAWRRLTRAAGLRGLRFHDLRHHAISVMGEKGVPDGTIKAVAGHVTQGMLDHYSHHRIEAKRIAVQALCSRVPAGVPNEPTDTSPAAAVSRASAVGSFWESSTLGLISPHCRKEAAI